MRICKICTLPEESIKFPPRGLVCNKCSYILALERKARKNTIIDYNQYKKICSFCTILLPASEFRKRFVSHDGLSSRCKSCDVPKAHEYYLANKDKIIQNSIKNANKNKEHTKKLSRIRQARRLKNDPQYKLARNTRHRLNEFLKSKGREKICPATVALGCSFAELKVHIEKQFTSEMNWENYGTVWHIDHIIPLNRFDLTNHEDYKKACNYKNLRPLFKRENLARRDQINFKESLIEFDDFMLSLGFNKVSKFIYTKYNLMIIYSGLNSSSESLVGKRFHLDLMSKEHRTFIVFSDEWISRKDSVRGYIYSLLGKARKIGARECILKRIESSDYREFLEKYHMQGYNGYIGYGLYYQDELISVMTFKQLTENEYDLNRYCNKVGIMVIGGFQRLLNSFILDFNPKKIISFSDRRISEGGVYTRNGFKFVHNTEHTYWYFLMGKDDKKIHKMSFRKEKLANKFGLDKEDLDDLTEYEIAKKIGYERIWDCGNTKWELIIP